MNHGNSGRLWSLTSWTSTRPSMESSQIESSQAVTYVDITMGDIETWKLAGAQCSITKLAAYEQRDIKWIANQAASGYMRAVAGGGRPGMKDRLLKVVITETERALTWAARTHFGHMSSG